MTLPDAEASWGGERKTERPGERFRMVLKEQAGNDDPATDPPRGADSLQARERPLGYAGFRLCR